MNYKITKNVYGIYNISAEVSTSVWEEIPTPTQFVTLDAAKDYVVYLTKQQDEPVYFVDGTWLKSYEKATTEDTTEETTDGQAQ